MSIILAFVAAAVVTYLLRSSMSIIGVGRSAAIQRGITLVTPAVLAAMIASSLFVHHGDVAIPALPEVVAVVASAAVARRTGNVGLGLAAGLPVYWLGVFFGLA